VNIDAVKRWASAFASDPKVLEVWVVGSQAKGTATPESDIDLIAVVTGDLRRLSPNWQARGEEVGPGFPASIEGVATHWLFIAADEFDRSDLERNSDYMAAPIVLLYERARTVRGRVVAEVPENTD
jgi:hypothetical protein